MYMAKINRVDLNLIIELIYYQYFRILDCVIIVFSLLSFLPSLVSFFP